MALPVTITTQGDLAGGGGRPYISTGGNVYVFVLDDVTLSKFRAFKATDPTVSFSNVGTDPQITVGNTLHGIATYQVGDIIHVVTQDSNGGLSYNLRYHKFDMSSDSWTTTNEVIKSAFSPVSDEVAAKIALSVRSDGDVILLYNGAKVANMGADRERVYYARREAGVWTIDVAVDNGGATNWLVGGVVIGSSDRMHLFFQDDGADDAYQRCLRSADTLETFPSAFDTAILNDPEGMLHLGTSYDSSGTIKVRFPYYDSTTTTLNIAKCDSADTPTMSTDVDITGATAAGGTIQFRCSLAANGTTLHAFYFISGSDISRQTNANDAGWSSVSSFVVGTTEHVYTNVYTRGSDTVVGVVYEESNDPTYNELFISSTGSTIDMDATATASWNAKSTNTAAFNQSAAATLTWQGTGLFKAAFESDAVTLLTWEGTTTVAATAADWSLAAAASVTWGGNGLYPAAFDSDAVAIVTWNGISTTASNFDADAVASVTWNGISTATSTLDSDAAATLTWNGTGLAAANWSAVAAASLTWNGASFASVAFDSNALASVTWNGISTASSAFDADALATLIWNGTSSATSAWSSAAVANLTMAGTEVVNAAWSSTAAASVTWNGAAVTVAASDFNLAAAASLTWNGRATASASLSAAAAAALQWDAISTATGALSAPTVASLVWAGALSAGAAWSASALGTLAWEGAEIAGNFVTGDASFTAAGNAQFTSSSVAASTFEVIATASAIFKNGTPAVAAATRYDGWRIKHKQKLEMEEQEEDDMLILAAFLLAYLEQNYVYY